MFISYSNDVDGIAVSINADTLDVLWIVGEEHYTLKAKFRYATADVNSEVVVAQGRNEVVVARGRNKESLVNAFNNLNEQLQNFD